MSTDRRHGTRVQRWLTNVPALRTACCHRPGVQIDVAVPDRGGVIDGLRYFFKSWRYDVMVFDGLPNIITWMLCLLRYLLPLRQNRLVLVDVVFAPPGRQPLARLKARMAAALWRQVDLFVNYMKDTAGPRRFFGISEHRCAYVPFKVNTTELLGPYQSSEGAADDAYVFTGGQSRRDFSMFCRAMAGLPYRGMIVTPTAPARLQNGTSFGESALPVNVEVIHDDGGSRSWIEKMAKAKLAAFCIDRDSISPSGVSTYLLAMALRKCVIITDCPATRDILTHGKQALVVPPGDVEALRAALRNAMENHALRNAVAECGYRYALSLGGERELMQRIFDCLVAHFAKS